ncbi:acyltransferase 3 [Tricladium varicosporioides]|nr:acyltransferase 3 [Hymenoscyphus varicosporioides]
MGLEEATSLGTTEYVNGVRGVASVVVFAEHFLTTFHPNIFNEYGDSPTFFQLPGLRLLYSGSPMVAIFYVLSGFSLSIRPAKAIYARNWDELHQVLSSAILRRAIRLVLPCAIITFIVAMGTRFQIYENSHDNGSGVVLHPGPPFQDSFWLQILDWIEYVLGRLIYPATWFSPLPNITRSDYADPLYTIPIELWSSMALLTTISGLSRVQCAVRMTSLFFLIFFAAWCDLRDISCFLAGFAMAELHVRRLAMTRADRKSTRSGTIILSFLRLGILLAGIWLASIPHTHGSYGSSSFGYQTITKLIPRNSNNYNIGAVLIVFAIDYTPVLQSLFSMWIPQYLGKISFALYLVHWPILAAWGWSMVPNMWKFTGKDSDIAYEFGFWLAVVIVTPVIFWAADICWRVVDLNSIWFAKEFERMAAMN